MDDALEKITTILRNLFDEYEGPVTRSLTAHDVEQWDSLANVQLVVLVEQTFGVRFSTQEVRKFENLGDLIDSVNKKRSQK